MTHIGVRLQCTTWSAVALRRRTTSISCSVILRSYAMGEDIIHRLERAFSAIGFIALLGILLVIANLFGFLSIPAATSQDGVADEAAVERRVALVSGHAGFDSGAICQDEAGAVVLREVDVVAEIADQTAKRLRRRGFDVLILDEYDPRLDGLQAALLLSLHADSCLPATGYKAAYYVRSRTPMAGDRILECIDSHYAGITGLPKDPHTVTVDMTEYHAFRKVDQHTPAVILELGFLGGDGDLLTENASLVSKGVADSVLCFLAE